MTSSELEPHALGGGPLVGDRLMRFAYLDESGVANPKHERWVVVAGPIIDADRQWRRIETRLSDLADEYAPPEARDGFVFHATELWSGGKTLLRDVYPSERRWEALEALCSLAEEFAFPFVFGAVHRGTYGEATGGECSQAEITLDAQLVGFTLCMTLIERYMRALPNHDEVATITVERNSQTVGLFRNQQRRMKTTAALEGMNPMAAALWPVTRIVDSVNYCEKHDTSLLQLADVAALVIRKTIERNPHVDRFWSKMSEQVIGFPPSISTTFSDERA